MKNKIITILTLVVIVAITSCKKEYDTPDNKVDCEMNFQSHPKDNAYQELTDQYARDGFVGMTILVDHPSDGLWIGSSGYASIEDNVKMNPCHIHHTASLYKTYIATVIMQLVEENQVNLNDKLSDYLSADITDKIPNGNEIIIKNLLQQRTGIPDIFEVDFVLDFFNTPLKEYSVEGLLEYVYGKSSLSEPDTEFHYSDANFSLLTLVVEKVEGNYIQSIKSRIFQKLSLSDTYFLEDVDQVPVGLADSYWDRYSDGNIENNSDIQTSLTVNLRGSDGIITSANDLKIFMQALVSGDLVNDISPMIDFLEVTEETKENNTYTGYGFGLMRVNLSGEEWYGHFGNHIGSGSMMLYNPNKDLTIIALQNTGTFFSDEIKEKFFYQLIVDVEAAILN